tara:strand:+ start:319 stop:513 length:195 start_codon:yes stop_codon:yes gene_type:complete
MTDEDSIEVIIRCTLPTLRGLHECVCKCYRTWPGGDPQDQRNLETLKSGLYVILMDALLENDLV